jgi:hypothetical protein
MADTVASQILFEGDRKLVMKFTDTSDGTGETNVVKVNVANLTSAHGVPCTGVTIEKIFAMTHGMEVEMKWEATSPVTIMTIPQNVMNSFDFHDGGFGFTGLTNNAGTGKTGNITFSTLDASAGDRYSIVLYMHKVY